MPGSDRTVNVEGLVEESLPGLLFRVTLKTEKGKKEVLAHLGGKMRLYRIRVVPGDTVLVEMPSADDKRGRIIRRL